MKCKRVFIFVMLVSGILFLCSFFSCSYRDRNQVLVKGGVFTMGDGKSHALYDTEVTDFYVDRTEVTNRQFCEVYNWALENNQLEVVLFDGSVDIGTTWFSQSGSRIIETDHLILLRKDYPWPLLDEWKESCAVKFTGDRFEVLPGKEDWPVVEVSWYGAAAYCNFLSLMNGLTPVYETEFWEVDKEADGYSLPTNEQWEFAARGGIKSKGFPFSGGKNIDKVAWYKKNSEGKLHSVGTKEPNELELFDMNGNAWEFCTEKAGVFKGDINNSGLYTSYRLWRGGSFQTEKISLFSFVQHIDYPGYNYGNAEVGFRTVRLSRKTFH